MTFVDGGGLRTKADTTLRGLPNLAGKRMAIILGSNGGWKICWVTRDAIGTAAISKRADCT